MSFIDYLRETRGELKHVSWPTRNQTIAFTAIVVVVSFAVAYFLGLFDYGFAFLIERFILGR
ncbi:MAG: preprotein translocase subunit SecE [Candidatus Paceibacterota bacterium]|jgi:preprotein translocase subunit SecE